MQPLRLHNPLVADLALEDMLSIGAGLLDLYHRPELAEEARSLVSAGRLGCSSNPSEIM